MEYRLENGSTTRCSMVRAHIEEMLEPRSMVYKLASEMVTASYHFHMEYNKYVNRYYRNLAASTGVTEAEAWGIVMHMSDALFAFLRKARAPMKMMAENGNPIMYVWGALLTHQAAREFIKGAQIEDHPVMQGVQLRFIMKKKSDLHGLDRVNTDIRSLTNQIKDLKAKVTALEKQKGGNIRERKL